MTSRLSDNKKKEYLSLLDEHVMETPSLYFVDGYSNWTQGMRNKASQASLGSNPQTQLLQTAFIDSTTNQVQTLPEGHEWRTKGASVRYKGIFVDYTESGLTPTTALGKALDVLFSRACPPAIMFVAARGLTFLPRTFLVAQAKKRMGKIAGPAFIKMIAGVREFLDAVLEQRGPQRKAAQTRKISWGAMNKTRAKRTPSKPKAKAKTSTPEASEFANVEFTADDIAELSE